MPQCYLDQGSYDILKGLQNDMKKSGISGFTLGDAIRIIWQRYQLSTRVEPTDDPH